MTRRAPPAWTPAPAEDLEDAMLQLSAWARAHARESPPRIFICGSLYLADRFERKMGE